VRAESESESQCAFFPSSPRRSSPLARAPTAGLDGWTAAEAAAFRAALVAHPASLDKNERFRAVAKAVGTKSKADCHAAWKAAARSQTEALSKLEVKDRLTVK
jgi:hypothetical protein